MAAGGARWKGRAGIEPLDLNGVKIFKGWLGLEDQRALVEQVRAVAEVAPFVRPMTPWGKPMSVRMTSAGRVGWITDGKGYRYADRHPEGMAWPPIPPGALSVWEALSDWPESPDCCLVNFYAEKAKMGLHQDKDEVEFDAPVVSISLGDPAVFRVGGTKRSDPTASILLESGDVAVMGGDARLAYHGIDRVRFGGSSLLPNGGRINLTLRVVRN